ncbi:glutamyl-tRNA reductase [Thermovenabulum gondwanense]|uniref:Glutamyl-tRNA reductase n=1 Tax=Thermovenabulum gondwanense TaxID=520767 RepID=A0A162MRL4_9FIRM|nr:glutamyl-tRNA reductase [Thermovenabulum gondwanense]KYO67020.1 Glutamyl-tRNA reductase [Thermovenabulum gondwanense]
MLGVLGVNPKADIRLREKMVLVEKRVDKKMEDLRGVCGENIILNTCNRTEVYFVGDEGGTKDEILKILGWEGFKDYTFYYRDEKAAEHLFEVACGFDSLILGEEQILGQVKRSLERGRNIKSAGQVLNRLFLQAIACGKEFRTKAKLHEVPVSVASIVSKEIEKRGKKRVLIFGYGEIGRLCAKYLCSKDSLEKVYIAVRDLCKGENLGPKAVFVEFSLWRDYLKEVEVLISCTSSPHIVVKKEDVDGKKLLIFDLAVPRDVEEGALGVEGHYNIDEVSRMNEENLEERRTLMENNRAVLEKHVKEFTEWYRLREITPFIENVKNFAERVYKPRFERFKNKYRIDDVRTAELLFKSTADAFAENAIRVLKEEFLEGRGEECMRLIAKIFSD